MSEAGLPSFGDRYRRSPTLIPRRGLVDQPFASSEMGESMDADLIPELSGETWVATTLLERLTADLLPAGADLDLIVASRRTRCWRRSVSGFSLELFQCGLSVQDFLRSCVDGVCKSVTYPWIRTGVHGDAEPSAGWFSAGGFHIVSVRV